MGDAGGGGPPQGDASGASWVQEKAVGQEGDAIVDAVAGWEDPGTARSGVQRWFGAWA